MKSLIAKGVALSVIAAFLALPALAGTIQTAGKNGGEKTVAEKINLNTATAGDLQTLPGVGVKVAERILEFRKANGPFKKIEDLMKVRGIGEKMFLKFKERLTV